MAKAEGTAKKNKPEFSPAQIEGHLARMYNVTESSRLQINQALRTKSIEIKYFGERVTKGSGFNKSLYDHFYHPRLDYDQKSERCDRSRPTRFQNSIYEERPLKTDLKDSKALGLQTSSLSGSSNTKRQTKILFRKAAWFYSSWQEYTKSGFEEASKLFDESDLNISTRGKVYLITGANSGIGQAIACEIARRGGTVHMVCRNHQRGEHVQTTIMNETGNQDIHLHLVDLSQPRNVFRFAQDFRDQSGKLDVLIHNAGSMVANRQTDPDGIEKNFAVNVLAPHILTRQLIPLLHKAKPGRVIFVSAGGMLVQKLDVTDIQCQRMKPGDVTLIYANHKRQQVVLAEMYSRDYPDIFCASMHPGWVDTAGMKEAQPEFAARMKDRLRTPAQGADTALWLAIAERPCKNTSGLFYQDRVAIPPHLPMSFTKASLLEEESFIKQLDQMMERLRHQ